MKTVKHIRTRDAERSKLRILSAAQHEFTRRGFDGCSVEEIARRAGVTKQLVLHHFKNKKNLYAVIHTVSVRSTIPKSSLENRSIEEFLVQRYDRLAGDLDFVRFLVWECAKNWDKDLPGSKERRDTVTEQLGNLKQLQKLGRVRADVDVRYLLLAIFALTTYPLAFAPIARMISGMNPADARFKRGWTSFLKKIASSLTHQIGGNAM